MKTIQISRARSGMLFKLLNNRNPGLCTIIYKGLPRHVDENFQVVRLVYLSSDGRLRDEEVGTRYNVEVPDDG